MDITITPGSISRILEWGERPDTITLQVLGCKEIGNDRARMFLWDGKDEYKHAVLIKEGSNIDSPERFSIVKISDEERPNSFASHRIEELKNLSTKYALIFYHYTMVKNGKEVGKKIIPENNQVLDGNGDLNNAGSTVNTPPSYASKCETMAPPFKSSMASQFSSNRQAVKRNLDSTFDASVPKRCPPDGIDASPTHQVMDLNPYINRYKLKVRVSGKSPVKNITNSRFQGSVQNCIMSDESGSIKVNAWDSNGREDTKQLDKLEVGKTYMLEGLQVKPVHNTAYNTTGHNYELTWCQNTVVSGPITDNPVQEKYKFVTISSLASVSANTVVDVVGWVREIGELNEFRSRAEKDLKKREIVLADNSNGGSSINLVLWGTQAEKFFDFDSIIALKGAQVKEFNGQKSISIGFSGSYEVSPNIPEVVELEKWADSLRGINSQMPSSQLSQATGSSVQGEWSTIQEIKELLAVNRLEKKFTFIARVIKIKIENMWYRAHQPRDGKKCMKKVTANSSDPELYDCKCGDKKLSESETELRFMVNICLADTTSSCWATFFSASSLFNMSAQELHDLRNRSESDFLDLISKKQFMEARFTVSAKVETYNQSPQLRFTVQDMEEIKWGAEEDAKNHIKRRWEDIMAMEKELGVSHEEEYGIAVTGTAAFSNP